MQRNASWNNKEPLFLRVQTLIRNLNFCACKCDRWISENALWGYSFTKYQDMIHFEIKDDSQGVNLLLWDLKLKRFIVFV